MSKWISVADRLPSPECDTAYAVIRSGKATVEDWEVEYQQFEQMHSSITHWMPLPKVDATDHAEALAKLLDNASSQIAAIIDGENICYSQSYELVLRIKAALNDYREATE